MSSASIIVRQPKRRVASIKALRPVLGLSIAVLGRRLDEGRPIIEAELFLNDFADLADKLRETLRTLESLGDDYAVFEDEDEISGEVLINILEGSESYRL